MNLCDIYQMSDYIRIIHDVKTGIVKMYKTETKYLRRRYDDILLI